MEPPLYFFLLVAAIGSCQLVVAIGKLSVGGCYCIAFAYWKLFAIGGYLLVVATDGYLLVTCH